MALPLRLLRLLAGFAFAALTAGLLGLAVIYFTFADDLPDVSELQDMRLQVPLRVYSRNGQLIAEYGSQRRRPIAYEDYPEVLIQAVLAAEDDRYFEHPGVDYQGLLRAAAKLLLTGEKEQGGSTITMQMARNFFLSRDKTYERKLREILLALRIERAMPKERILELYLNKIYLGQRAYGMGAAAYTYYGKDIGELTLPQAAMLAGLPQAPSRVNPVANPVAAKARRDYVLRRMLKLAMIDQPTYEAALAEPVSAEPHPLRIELEADYVGELARQQMVDRYGESAYTRGLVVYTTVDSRMQHAAQQALRRNLIAYAERHGWEGPLARIAVPALPAADSTERRRQWVSALEKALGEHREIGGLSPTLVLAVDTQAARVYVAGHGEARLPWNAMSWAKRRPARDGRAEAKTPAELLERGDVVYVSWDDGEPRLAPKPALQGALVALDPLDGGILSLVGGFDFDASAFNRAVQARRQAGSSFKPFLYTAALDRGLTAATVINDAPVVFEAADGSSWRPKNYSGRFYGPTRLREAVVHSRNLVSVRVLERIGIGYALRYLERFGFEREALPRNLSLSLGSASFTPLEMARAYAVFANGGYLIEPYMISRVEDGDGTILYASTPALACDHCASRAELLAERGWEDAYWGQAAGGEVLGGPDYVPLPRENAPRVIEPDTIYLMNDILKEVISRGTARRAASLGRADLAGKTGTTNEQRDAWFAGYNALLTAVVWIGHDDPQPMGRGESGGRTALPVWIDYMREALAEVPEQALPQPEELVSLRVSARTGLRADAGTSGTVFELFRLDALPAAPAPAPMRKVAGESSRQGAESRTNIMQDLF